MDLGSRRREKLEESCKAYQLVREAGELAQWINDKEQIALSDEVGDDLEQVEVVQRKFDDFQKDLKANEARLVELNTIAERLTAMGQTEAAEKIRIQIEDLNQRWAALQQVTQEKAQTLGSAHEVQRYHRSAKMRILYNDLILILENHSFHSKYLIMTVHLQRCWWN